MNGSVARDLRYAKSGTTRETWNSAIVRSYFEIANFVELDARVVWDKDGPVNLNYAKFRLRVTGRNPARLQFRNGDCAPM